MLGMSESVYFCISASRSFGQFLTNFNNLMIWTSKLPFFREEYLKNLKNTIYNSLGVTTL